jgi:glycosyltransferase involved in cell wall biosynthesis
VSDAAPAVSIVLPVHNRVELLPRALESALAQTFGDFELIVVDDASTEDVRAVAERYDDPRVRLAPLARHAGIGGARNAGIAAARSAWIALLDSDDEWLPTYLERQVAQLRAHPDAAVGVTKTYVNIDDGRKVLVRPDEPLPEGDVLDSLFTRVRAQTASAYVIRRDALLAVGGFHTALPSADDLHVLLLLGSAGYRFAADQEPLAVKYQHDRGQVTADPMARLQGSVYIERRWGPLARERLGEQRFRRWRRRRRHYVRRAHEKYVAALIDANARGTAWRYVWRASRYAVWVRRPLRRALAFALIGRGLYAKLEPARPADAPDG